MSAYIPQNYTYQLNARKGWPHPYAVDYLAKISADVKYNLRPGQCCSLNSNGLLEPGVSGTRMPMFIFQGAASLDVDTPVGGLVNDIWAGGTPPGSIVCIPAKAAVELETTEFVQANTYTYNDLLRAPTGNAATDEKLVDGIPVTGASGVLTNVGSGGGAVKAYTDVVVGVVSGIKYKNYNGRWMLPFWPVYLPIAV